MENACKRIKTGDDHVGSEEQKQPSFLLALLILVFKGMQILS